MNKSVSGAEKDYITLGVLENVRGDGRLNTNLRAISIEDQVLPHLHGSSKVSIGNATDVMCSVKLTVDTPQPEASSSGILDIRVDISQFTNVRVDERQLQEIGSNLAESLRSMLDDSDALNLKEFCIIPEVYCWVIHVDILVLRVDGSLLEAASMAILSALKAAKVPKVNKIIGESGVEEDFEVSGDLGEAVGIGCSKVPLFITVVKIGNCLVLDPSHAELMCASGQLTIAIDREGCCCGLEKTLKGTFTFQEIGEAIEIASEAVNALFVTVDKIHAQSTKSLYPQIPPQRIGLLA